MPEDQRPSSIGVLGKVKLHVHLLNGVGSVGIDADGFAAYAHGPLVGLSACKLYVPAANVEGAHCAQA
jgi:hypothetical protein